MVVRHIGLLIVAATLSACATPDTTTRNITMDLAPVTAGSEAEAAIGPVALQAITFTFPDDLIISESNGYYPFADVVWRGDAVGDRRLQIAAMFEEAANRHIGARPLPDAQPVIAEITLRRFHGVTERTRFSVGGVYSIRFDLQLLDAGTREPLGEVRTIQADLPAPGGIAAVELERAGQTERVRVVDHLTWTLQRELRLPAPG